MSKYQCDVCNRKFMQKCHLDNHLNRKNKCQPHIQQLHENTPKLHEIAPQLHEKQLKMHENTLNLHENTPKIPEIDPNKDQHKMDSNNVHKCNYCNKTFSRKNVVYKHIKESCKIANQQNKEKQEIFDKLVALEEKNKVLEEEIKNKDKVIQTITINNNTNTNNSNNNNNNNTINVINIVPHGEEDLVKNKVDDLLLILSTKKGYNAVLELITRVHFNSRFPEFQNVYIPDIKNNTAMVFDQVWELKNIDDVISNLYDTKSDYITDNKDIFFKHLNPGEQLVYQRWATSNSNRDSAEFKSYIKDTHNKIKLLMYNKREMVITTKKLQIKNN